MKIGNMKMVFYFAMKFELGEAGCIPKYKYYVTVLIFVEFYSTEKISVKFNENSNVSPDNKIMCYKLPTNKIGQRLLEI
jgi:hypothetical protein